MWNKSQNQTPAAFTLALALSLVVLSAAVSMARADTGTPPGEYRLAPGDRIAVTVFGQPDLTGEFPLDGTGSISFPIAGRLELGKLTASEAQERIRAVLADGILNEPSVFVRIPEMRPVQVLGDVRSPGSFPYRYGLIVKAAVGFAGGYGTAALSPNQAISDYIAADERLRVLEDQYWRLQIRTARLQAQLEGRDEFGPPAVSALVTKEAYDAVVAEETATLLAQGSELKRTTLLIQGQRDPLAAERTSIESQVKSERKQLELIADQLREYRKLQRTGLARFETMIQIQISQAAKEGIVWRLEGDRSRLEASIGEIEIRLQQAHSDFRRLVMAELDGVRQRLREIEVAMPTARELRAARIQAQGSAASADVPRRYLVTRADDTGVRTIEVADDAVLQPGDVLEVKMLVPPIHQPASFAPMGAAASAPSNPLKVIQ